MCIRDRNKEPRLRFTDEERSAPALEKPIRKAEKAAARADKAQMCIRDSLLISREVENIFENSDFVYMLNQAGGDRQILAKQLGISTHQLSYVTHSGEGEGLLFYGSTILPFVDHFPKNTELYRIMTCLLYTSRCV